jgi:hypothetical protein
MTYRCYFDATSKTLKEARKKHGKAQVKFGKTKRVKPKKSQE